MRTDIAGPAHVGSDHNPPNDVRAQRCEGLLVSLAGFRHLTNLYAGPHLYIDDLSTLPSARGKGHAGALLRWVDEEARRLGCAGVHLDSGTQRHDAHRLYLASGFVIPAFHFAKSL